MLSGVPNPNRQDSVCDHPILPVFYSCHVTLIEANQPDNPLDALISLCYVRLFLKLVRGVLCLNALIIEVVFKVSLNGG